MQLLIGIDMGTTNTKAICFNENGETIAAASLPTKTVQQKNNGYVYDAEEIWPTVCQLLREISGKLTALSGRKALYKIAGLSVTGMAEAGIPVNAKGEPLYDVITWFDTRTAGYNHIWSDIPGDGVIEEITGLHPQFIFSANKILWLAEHVSGFRNSIAGWHCIPDYITWRLTGNSVMDYSLGCRTMMMDIKTKMWSREILSIMGIPKEIMPELRPSGYKIGTITEYSSGETGLPAGIPVYTGGHDHVCGALAVGVTSSRRILDSCGTSEEILTASDNETEVLDIGKRGFNIGPHTALEQYYIAGGLPASGLSIDWYRKNFADERYNCSVPGANGVMFLPDIRGSSSPERNATSKGAFLGLRDTTTSDDCMQAVYEGLAYTADRILNNISDKTLVEQIICIGGGSNNKAWMQIKADIYNRVIEIPVENESAALGAALLAGKGCGLFKDERDAYKKTYREKYHIIPDPGHAEFYMDHRQQYYEKAELLGKLNNIS